MGKRFRNKGGKNSKNVVEANSDDNRFEMDAINTWDDIEHDEVDKFHEQRDKIDLKLFDDRNDLIEDTEEVFGLDLEDSEEEEYDEDQPDEIDEWGGNRADYYDGDEAEDEEDARLEEEEAIRIQKMRANAMKEEDFMDHIPGQLSGKAIVKDAHEDNNLILNLDSELKNIDLTAPIEQLNKTNKEYTPEEALEILETQSPEFLGLLQQLEEQWVLVKDKMTGLAERIKALKPEVVKNAPLLQHFYLKYETILSYLTNIAFYIYLKSSGTPNLQDHPIIDVLLKHAKILKDLEEAEEGSDDLNEMVDEALTVVENGGSLDDNTIDIDNEDVHLDEDSNLQSEYSMEDAEKEEEIESIQSEEDFEAEHQSESEESAFEELPEQTLAQLKRSLKASVKKNKSNVKVSDFQDSEYLDEMDAIEKAIKKKSLRHHASHINQITQKRSRIPKYSGDADVPYKLEEKKNKAPANQAINQESNDADIFDDEDDQMPIVEKTKVEKRQNKRVKYVDPEEMAKRTELWKELNPDEQEVGDSKRIASYKILKNKGLAPKRKKEQRNPRVKHRKKFEKATKKLSSFKRIVKEQKTSYGGEATGIKTHLSRSVRFR